MHKINDGSRNTNIALSDYSDAGSIKGYEDIYNLLQDALQTSMTPKIFENVNAVLRVLYCLLNSGNKEMNMLRKRSLTSDSINRRIRIQRKFLNIHLLLKHIKNVLWTPLENNEITIVDQKPTPKEKKKLNLETRSMKRFSGIRKENDLVKHVKSFSVNNDHAFANPRKISKNKFTKIKTWKRSSDLDNSVGLRKKVLSQRSMNMNLESFHNIDVNILQRKLFLILRELNMISHLFHSPLVLNRQRLQESEHPSKVNLRKTDGVKLDDTHLIDERLHNIRRLIKLCLKVAILIRDRKALRNRQLNRIRKHLTIRRDKKDKQNCL